MIMGIIKCKNISGVDMKEGQMVYLDPNNLGGIITK